MVLSGRSQQIAHCLPTLSSSLSPGSTLVTRLGAFGGGGSGGASSKSLPLESALTWRTSRYCWNSASVPVGEASCETHTRKTLNEPRARRIQFLAVEAARARCRVVRVKFENVCEIHMLVFSRHQYAAVALLDVAGEFSQGTR